MRRASEERQLSKEELWELMQLDEEASALHELGLPVPEGLVLPCAVAVQERLRRALGLPMEEREARLIAWVAFHARHPSNTVPGWFLQVASDETRRDEAGRWVVELKVHQYPPLGPEYVVEVHDGHRTLVHTDPNTGESRVVLSFDPRPIRSVTFFRVTVDPHSAQAAVELDVAPASLAELKPDPSLLNLLQ